MRIKHGIWGLFFAAALINGSTAFAGDDSHRAAAIGFLEASEVETTLSSAISTSLDAQMTANPMLVPYRPAMEMFFAKYMSWDALEDDFIELYVAEFTEKELKQLTKFYKTPVGKKSVSKLPVLMQRGSEIGQKHVEDNMGELQRMIAEQAAAQ